VLPLVVNRMALCSSQVIRMNPWTCLSCSTLTRTTQALITGSTSRSPAHIHQRKHSSSKTPSPPKDDSRVIATHAEASTKEAKTATKEGAEKRPSARISKRKPRDGLQDNTKKYGDELALNLPSVPSTTHLHPSGMGSVFTFFLLNKRPSNEIEDIHMSSFFSIHRPISLTTPIPNESSNKAFSRIFDAKPPSRAKTADVIYTLSSAVDNLESAASASQSQDAQQMSPEEMDLRQAVTQASSSNSDHPTHHLDIPAKTLHLNLQELAKNFRPFVPPPAPVPLGARTESSQRASHETQSQTEADTPPEPTQKSYTTTLTIHETSYPNGQKTYKTHTTPIIEGPSPESSGNSIRYLPPAPQNQPFLGRMRQRQAQYLERVGESDGWMAISVKRQRKLKMKKHKYKKLMKRTKNLRRKLDRL